MTIQQGDQVIFVQVEGSEPINDRTEHNAYVSAVLPKGVLDLTVYYYDGIPEVVKKVPPEDKPVAGKGHWKQL